MRLRKREKSGSGKKTWEKRTTWNDGGKLSAGTANDATTLLFGRVSALHVYHGYRRVYLQRAPILQTQPALRSIHRATATGPFGVSAPASLPGPVAPGKWARAWSGRAAAAARPDRYY